MAFALYSLVQAVVLCLNAVCVLNEERFLSKLSISAPHRGFGENNNKGAVASQALNLVRAVQTVMKIPLIALNVMDMTVEVLFG